MPALRVQIFLAGAAAETLAQLEALGFESATKSSSAKILVGRLTVEQLPAVIRVAAVQFVSPVSP